jgi:drug/metabolite transporter (DMT)-like permease
VNNFISRNSQNKELIAWLLLIFLAIVWGMSFILIKKITGAYNAIEIGGGRVLVAMITLSPWIFKNRREFPKEKKQAFYLVLLGFLGFFIPAMIFAYVGSRINSSLAGTLNSTTPIFTLLVGAFFFSQLITRYQIIGILLGFTGSLLLVLSGNDGELNFTNPNALLVLGATVMYGFNVNIIGEYLKGVKAVNITAFSLIVVGVISFFMLVFFTDFFAKSLDPANTREFVYLIILGGFNSAFAVVLFNYVLQITSPLFGSSVTYLIPIVATIAGFLDGEVISFWHYFGMGVILIGVYLINKK